ncbi:hypothetical protein BDY17DRAFT_193870 [Neohortaea acidophila]|uniref:Uncharacterized protein n=1 Tax=Neohortaea acidophila TaxID=245834 RepID=A0A6A6PM09_9PEZI|nr:uncharacterized protein BDY17DRAFT_193870 [Neohortaea acidophila]KAF2480503.1 hypothetical protein BDY17DRAFT_193870 [Neohortaea acidophila]
MVKIEQNDGHGNRTAGEHPSSSSSPTQHHPSTADHLIAAVEAAPESSSRKASRASARTYEYQPVETSTQTLGLDKRPEDQPHLIIDEVGGRRTTRRSVAAPGAYTAASRIAATPAPPAVPAAALSRAQTVAPSSKPRQQRQASAAPTPAPARPSSSAPTSDSNVRQQRAATAVPSPAPGSNNATLKNTKRKFSPGKVPETIDEEHSEADSQDLDLGPRKRARQGSVGRGMVEELKKKVSEEEAAGVEQGEVVEEEIEQQQQQQDEMEEEEMDEQLLLQMGEEEMEQLQQEMKGKEVDQQLLQQMGEEEIDDDEEEYDSDTIEVKPRVKGTEPAKKAKGDGKGKHSSSQMSQAQRAVDEVPRRK